MKQFTNVNEMIAAYVIHYNSRCSHPDQYFTAKEVGTYHLDTIMRQSMALLFGIAVTSKQAFIIRGFGYVEGK